KNLLGVAFSKAVNETLGANNFAGRSQTINAKKYSAFQGVKPANVYSKVLAVEQASGEAVGVFNCKFYVSFPTMDVELAKLLFSNGDATTTNNAKPEAFIFANLAKKYVEEIVLKKTKTYNNNDSTPDQLWPFHTVTKDSDNAENKVYRKVSKKQFIETIVRIETASTNKQVKNLITSFYDGNVDAFNTKYHPFFADKISSNSWKPTSFDSTSADSTMLTSDWSIVAVNNVESKDLAVGVVAKVETAVAGALTKLFAKVDEMSSTISSASTNLVGTYSSGGSGSHERPYLEWRRGDVIGRIADLSSGQSSTFVDVKIIVEIDSEKQKSLVGVESSVTAIAKSFTKDDSTAGTMLAGIKSNLLAMEMEQAGDNLVVSYPYGLANTAGLLPKVSSGPAYSNSENDQQMLKSPFVMEVRVAVYLNHASGVPVEEQADLTVASSREKATNAVASALESMFVTDLSSPTALEELAGITANEVFCTARTEDTYNPKAGLPASNRRLVFSVTILGSGRDGSSNSIQSLLARYNRFSSFNHVSSTDNFKTKLQTAVGNSGTLNTAGNWVVADASILNSVPISLSVALGSIKFSDSVDTAPTALSAFSSTNFLLNIRKALATALPQMVDRAFSFKQVGAILLTESIATVSTNKLAEFLVFLPDTGSNSLHAIANGGTAFANTWFKTALQTEFGGSDSVEAVKLESTLTESMKTEGKSIAENSLLKARYFYGADFSLLIDGANADTNLDVFVQDKQKMEQNLMAVVSSSSPAVSLES
ncbi:unnamed protein product, partial [Amoebophrya sp. A120]